MRDVTELVELRDRAYEGGVELKNAIVNKTEKMSMIICKCMYIK